MNKKIFVYIYFIISIFLGAFSIYSDVQNERREDLVRNEQLSFLSSDFRQLANEITNGDDWKMTAVRLKTNYNISSLSELEREEVYRYLDTITTEGFICYEREAAYAKKCSLAFENKLLGRDYDMPVYNRPIDVSDTINGYSKLNLNNQNRLKNFKKTVKYSLIDKKMHLAYTSNIYTLKIPSYDHNTEEVYYNFQNMSPVGVLEHEYRQVAQKYIEEKYGEVIKCQEIMLDFDYYFYNISTTDSSFIIGVGISGSDIGYFKILS